MSKHECDSLSLDSEAGGRGVWSEYYRYYDGDMSQEGC